VGNDEVTNPLLVHLTQKIVAIVLASLEGKEKTTVGIDDFPAIEKHVFHDSISQGGIHWPAFDDGAYFRDRVIKMRCKVDHDFLEIIGIQKRSRQAPIDLRLN
jgi:hypothetical protein